METVVAVNDCFGDVVRLLERQSEGRNESPETNGDVVLCRQSFVEKDNEC